MSDVFNVDLRGWLKPVFTCLALRANDTNECWPSHARIARDCGCTDRTVRSALAELERMGVIFRVRSNGRVTTRYGINTERASALTRNVLPTKESNRDISTSSQPKRGCGGDTALDLPQRIRVIERRRQVRDGFLSMLTILGPEGYVTVPGLAKELGMAPEKVRNDLMALFRSLDLPTELHVRLRKVKRKPWHKGHLKPVTNVLTFGARR